MTPAIQAILEKHLAIYDRSHPWFCLQEFSKEVGATSPTPGEQAEAENEYYRRVDEASRKRRQGVLLP